MLIRLPCVEDPYSLMDDPRQYTLEVSSGGQGRGSMYSQPEGEEEPLGFDVPLPASPGLRVESTEDLPQSHVDFNQNTDVIPPRAAAPLESAPALRLEVSEPVPRPPEVVNAHEVSGQPKPPKAAEKLPGPITYLVTVKDVRDEGSGEPREEVFRMKARCAWKKMTRRFSDSVNPRPDDSVRD